MTSRERLASRREHHGDGKLVGKKKRKSPEVRPGTRASSAARDSTPGRFRDKTRDKSSLSLPERLENASFQLLCVVPVAIPLVFWPAVDRSFSMPKATLLFLAGAASAGLLLWRLALGARPFRGQALIPILVCGFVALAGVASIVSIAPIDAIWGNYRQNSGLVTWASLASIALLAASLAWDEERIRGLLDTTVLTAAIVSIFAIIQQLTPEVNALFGIPIQQRNVYSTFGNATFLGSYLSFAIPVCLVHAYSALQTARKPAAALVGLTALLSLGALALTQARGSWLALGLILPLLLFLLARRGWSRKHSIAAVMAVTIAGFFLFSPVFGEKGSYDYPAQRLFKEMGSLEGRLSYLQASRNAIAERPMTGWGPDTFAAVYTRFATRSPSHPEPDRLTADTPHNIFAGIGVDLGLPALAVFCALLALSAGKLAAKRVPLGAQGLGVGALSYLIAASTTTSSLGASFIPWLAIGVAASIGARLALYTPDTGQAEAGAVSATLSQVTGGTGSPWMRATFVTAGAALLAVAAVGTGAQLSMLSADSIFRSANMESEPLAIAALTERALALRPDNEDYLLSAADARAVAGEGDAAMKHVRRAAALRPSSYEPHMMAAMITLAPSGQKLSSEALSRAETELDIALQLFPGSQRLLKLKAKVTAAR